MVDTKHPVGFIETCWHEAGHGVMAGIVGIETIGLRVYQKAASGLWTGFRAGPSNINREKLDVLAAGVAGEMIYNHFVLGIDSKGNDGKSLFEIALSRGLNDMDDFNTINDRYNYSEVGFIAYTLSIAYDKLYESRHALNQMANELRDYRGIGRCVYAALMSGDAVTDKMRDMDQPVIAIPDHLR